jgi:hypothetical protein
MVWLQKTQTINDQVFHSSAIFASAPTDMVTTSRRATKANQPTGSEGNSSTALPLKAVIGAATSITGYVVQFVGLRSMHFSAFHRSACRSSHHGLTQGLGSSQFGSGPPLQTPSS